MFVVKKKKSDIVDILSHCNQVFFMPKPNHSIDAALSQDTAESLTIKNVKLQHGLHHIATFLMFPCFSCH